MALSEKAARSKDLSVKTPKLQHRHFAFIASCIRDIPTPSARVEAASVFVNELRRTNPAFGGFRFTEACHGASEDWTLHGLELAVSYAAFWLEYLKSELLQRSENVE